jgi:cobalt-zinc-cadmium efflux system outer membrane protein
MKIKWVAGVWAGAALLSFGGRSGAISIDDVLVLIEQRNPEVRAARAEAEAARAKPGRESGWRAPVLSFSREKTMGGDTITHLKGEQDIPFPGKLSLSGTAAEQEAVAAVERARAKELAVRGRGRTLYFFLWKTDQTLLALEEQKAVVDGLMASARARMAAGGAMGSSSMEGDLFSLQAQRGRLENRWLSESQERKAAAYELNALSDRSLSEPWDNVSAPLLRPLPLTVEELVRRALANGPAALAVRAEEASARAQWKRARMSFLPDFGVMYERMRDQAGMKGSEAGISASVPLWWSVPLSERNEARALWESAQGSARAMEIDVERAVSTAAAGVEEVFVRAHNVESTILPSTRSAFSVIRQRYENGSADVVRLLDALEGWLEAEMERAEVLAQYALRWGTLEEWAGVRLEEPK